MRRRLTVLATCVAFVAVPATSPATATNGPRHGTTAITVKTCRSGYTHAVIGGQQNCLHAGEFCARRYQRRYRHYGYSCSKRDRNGRYHLVRI